MKMGMKSLKWEGTGTKNLFPHTSTLVDVECGDTADLSSGNGTSRPHY